MSDKDCLTPDWYKEKTRTEAVMSGRMRQTPELRDPAATNGGVGSSKDSCCYYYYCCCCCCCRSRRRCAGARSQMRDDTRSTIESRSMTDGKSRGQELEGVIPSDSLLIEMPCSWRSRGLAALTRTEDGESDL